MKFIKQKTHIIDFIFPIALLFVFAVSALVITLFAANVYEETVYSSSCGDTSRTSLAYVTEKIHASALDGKVALGKFDGCDAVILSEEINKEKYFTYIYVRHGQLFELFAKADTKFSATNGTKILDVNSFKMERKADNLLLFTCIDDEGQSVSAVVGIK